MRYFVIFSCRKNDHPPCENSVFSLRLFPTSCALPFCLGQAGRFLFYFILTFRRVMRNSVCENSVFLLQLFPANVCVCVCYDACEDSAFSLWLFPAYVCVCVCARRNRSRVKIPRFCCGYFRLMCACVCATLHVKIPRFCCGYSQLMCSEFSLENEVLKLFFLTGIFGCPTVRKFRKFVAAVASLLLFVVVCLSLSGVSFIYFL